MLSAKLHHTLKCCTKSIDRLSPKKQNREFRVLKVLFLKSNDKYKKLSLVDKKIAIDKEIKETLALLEKLHERLGKENEILFNKEVLDVKDGVSNEEDFVEAMFVYVLTIQESLASYVDLIDKK